jgi:hypothetical protein
VKTRGILNRPAVAFGIAAAGLSVGCAGSPRHAAPRPIQVWRAGDDGLTVRFREAVEEALASSPASSQVSPPMRVCSS